MDWFRRSSLLGLFSCSLWICNLDLSFFVAVAVVSFCASSADVFPDNERMAEFPLNSFK